MVNGIDPPLVETRCGRVRGIAKAGVLQFRGVPFAAPPVGEARWRPPRPLPAWTGIRDADRFGAVAQQVPAEFALVGAAERPEMSEDCLYLNVFTPGIEGEPRPVMVWVHGGAFTSGSGRDAWYNGSSFARQGIVVVTINYRLGAFGFLHLGAEFPGSGNCGLLDQVAALQWVRDNIAAFGGDPENVTVFGESAGGMSIGALMGAPTASGLFHRAAPQSGAASNVNSPSRASQVTERLLAKVGGLDLLLTAPAEQVLRAQAEIVEESGGPARGLVFQPVVDGVVLPQPPLDTVRAGGTAPVQLMTGTNRDEMTLFMAAIPGLSDASEEDVVRRLDRSLPGTGRALYDGYRALLGGTPAPRDIWVAVESDRVFRVPAIRLAEAAASRTPDVWMYLFTWESPALGGLLRSAHALEIPFVWNSLDVEGTELFTGTGPETTALAAAMHETWATFARTGDPGWPRYDAGRRATRIFGPEDRIEDDPMGEMRRMWDVTFA